MIYQTFNNSCLWAALANVLSQKNIKTTDRELLLKSGLYSLFMKNSQGSYFAGAMLQEKIFISHALSYYELDFEERVFASKEEAIKYINENPLSIVSLKVNGRGHACVFKTIEEGKFTFLNMRYEGSDDQDFKLTKDELNHLLKDEVHVGKVVEGNQRTSHLFQLIQESINNIDDVVGEILTISTEVMHNDRAFEIREKIFRSIFIDLYSMFEITSNEDFANLKSIRDAYFQTFGKNEVNLSVYLNIDLLIEILNRHKLFLSKRVVDLILEYHLSQIKKITEVKSVILVGSLSNGSFTGNPGSDVDLIHVVDSFDGQLREKIRDEIRRTNTKFMSKYKISECVYSETMMITGLDEEIEISLDNKDLLELPIELLRIRESGKTVFGEDKITSYRAPSRNEVLNAKKGLEMLREYLANKDPIWYEGYLKMKKNPTPRIIVQSVLTRAMFEYYLMTGKSCSNKNEVGRLMRKDVPSYKYLDLLDYCVNWRQKPNYTSEVIEYLKNQYKGWLEDREQNPLEYVPIIKTR